MPATQQYAESVATALTRRPDDIPDVVLARARVARSLSNAPFWVERYSAPVVGHRGPPVPLSMLRRTSFDAEPGEPYQVVAFVEYDEPDEPDDSPW